MIKSKLTLSFIAVLMITLSAGRLTALVTCPDLDKAPEKVLLDVNLSTDTPFVDPDREIKDFGTSIVVKEFFKSEKALFNFMKLAYGTISDRLARYRNRQGLDDRAISVLFKGGNVVRIIANQAMSMLPPEARSLLEKAYGDVTKRSDLDFNVLVDDAELQGLSYQKVLNDVTGVVYAALNRVRKEVRTNPEKYFDFLQLTTKMAQKELKEYFDKLKDLEMLKDPNNPNWHNVKSGSIAIFE